MVPCAFRLRWLSLRFLICLLGHCRSLADPLVGPHGASRKEETQGCKASCTAKINYSDPRAFRLARPEHHRCSSRRAIWIVKLCRWHFAEPGIHAHKEEEVAVDRVRTACRGCRRGYRARKSWNGWETSSDRQPTVDPGTGPDIGAGTESRPDVVYAPRRVLGRYGRQGRTPVHQL